ncbi:hypothetical protein BTA51_04435 [Hahella sp. CCB-MM4]|uniref:hypothetical protein n=1 Tax=Hahella sp. (strain CCB-MM4) TaxID=1926491 RepID=UPI000B9C330B|nr:hypothetical protein [Hahella sp. CCB-MM4]OZG74269.1 hypothetical protein BTA51_04435 [Hahella sp. CCB-MM4]
MDDPDPTTSSRYLWIAAFATVMLGMTLFWIDQFLITPDAPVGIVSFELAKHIPQTQNILESWGSEGRHWAAWSLVLDFPFLLAYSALFTLLTLKSRSDLRQLFTVGFVIAGFCDVVENLALTGILAGYVYPQLTAAAYYFASLKFLLLFTGWAFLGSQVLVWLWERVQTVPAASQGKS